MKRNLLLWLKRKNESVGNYLMEVLFVTDEKQIDFFTADFCKPCKPALATIKKVAAKHSYKVRVIDILKTDKPFRTVPLACISKIDKNGYV